MSCGESGTGGAGALRGAGAWWALGRAFLCLTPSPLFVFGVSALPAEPPRGLHFYAALIVFLLSGIMDRSLIAVCSSQVA